MESTNLHHHQQHHHLHQLIVGSSSSSSSSANASFDVTSNDHGWRTTNFLLNNSNIHANCSEAPPNNPLNNSMIQDMGFPWSNDSTTQASSHHELPLITHKIKQESPNRDDNNHHNHHQHHDNSCNYPKLSDEDNMLSPSASPSEILLLKTLSPSYKHHMLSSQELQLSKFQPSIQYHNNCNNHPNTNISSCSKIFPSVNISNLRNNNNNNNDNMTANNLSSSSMEMNGLQGGLDLFATANLLSSGGSLSQEQASSNSHLVELFKGCASPFGAIDHDLEQSSDLKLCNSVNHLSSFNNNNGLFESKRPSCIVEPNNNSNHQMASKKSRFESRTSYPPIKVRKEKLGDRIAALQQLVAPFGKTDTASVLMEAIGYIKFLQNQVETLSVPYMKPSARNKSTNINMTQRFTDDETCEIGEMKAADLRSRGLCLVPLSCMSYIASDVDNGGIWPPPSFSHGF